MLSLKRLFMIFLLNSVVVCSTNLQSSISTGVQSENHVFIAVGVSWFERISMTLSHISLSEFIPITVYLNGVYLINLL